MQVIPITHICGCTYETFAALASNCAAAQHFSRDL